MSDDTGGWVAPAVEIPAVVAVVFMLKVSLQTCGFDRTGYQVVSTESSSMFNIHSTEAAYWVGSSRANAWPTQVGDCLSDVTQTPGGGDRRRAFTRELLTRQGQDLPGLAFDVVLLGSRSSVA